MLIKKQKYLNSTSIVSDIFQVSLISYLVLLLIEEFASGFATNFLNINWLLGIIVVSGVLTIIFYQEDKQQETRQVKWWDYLLIVLLGISAGIIIFWQMQDLEWIAIVISIFSGLIIILISYFLINEDNLAKGENKEGEVLEGQIQKTAKIKAVNPIKNKKLLLILSAFILSIIITFYSTVNFLGNLAFIVSLLVGFCVLILLFYILKK